MVRWVVGSILHGVDPLSYFSFQPVLHDWCNKGRGMCYPVCGMMHIKHCQCILTVRHILVECNHLAQTRNDIFGRCGVVESFQFHPELIKNVLKDSEFYSKF